MPIIAEEVYRQHRRLRQVAKARIGEGGVDMITEADCSCGARFARKAVLGGHDRGGWTDYVTHLLNPAAAVPPIFPERPTAYELRMLPDLHRTQRPRRRQKARS